ncbi:MAG: DUF502 domain-containing protein [Azonexus sp.]|nr:DUF502 domain-containing protein [Azonexus sp.]
MKVDSKDSLLTGRGRNIGRMILIGFFTVALLWVTWLVFDFLLGILANAGRPLPRAAASAVAPASETLSAWLLDSVFQQLVAVLLTLAILYCIGLLSSVVLGRKLIKALKSLLARLPLVQTIYSGTRRFLPKVRKPPVSEQRVVLISFPTPEMKAVGFVTKILHDSDAGREPVAVYVPILPNPTSRYIEIVPADELVQTEWSIEEAMSFVMTGGVNSPDKVRYQAPEQQVGTGEAAL